MKLAERLPLSSIILATLIFIFLSQDSCQLKVCHFRKWHHKLCFLWFFVIFFCWEAYFTAILGQLQGRLYLFMKFYISLFPQIYYCPFQSSTFPTQQSLICKNCSIWITWKIILDYFTPQAQTESAEWTLQVSKSMHNDVKSHWFSYSFPLQ